VFVVPPSGSGSFLSDQGPWVVRCMCGTGFSSRWRSSSKRDLCSHTVWASTTAIRNRLDDGATRAERTGAIREISNPTVQ
jgi:hypothetical protein